MVGSRTEEKKHVWCAEALSSACNDLCAMYAMSMPTCVLCACGSNCHRPPSLHPPSLPPLSLPCPGFPTPGPEASGADLLVLAQACRRLSSLVLRCAALFYCPPRRQAEARWQTVSNVRAVEGLSSRPVCASTLCPVSLSERSLHCVSTTKAFILMLWAGARRLLMT